MNSIKKNISNNIIFYIGLIIIFSIKIIYLLNSTANVPLMDYWRYAHKMLPKIYNGGITFNDLWEPINAQRGFLNHFLFFINVKLFHWNTRVSIFIGAINLLISSIFIYNIFIKTIEIKNTIYYVSSQLLGIVLAIIMFNYQQWEIEIMEFSGPFSINILFVLFISWLSNEIFNDKLKAQKIIIIYCVLLFISICFIFSAFFPAVLLGIFFVGIFYFIINNNNYRITYYKYYIMVLISVLLAIIVYFHGMIGVTGNNYSIQLLFKSISNKVFFKGLLYFAGGSILHVEFFAKSYKIYYLVGFLVISLYICSFYVFIKAKVYQKTCVPVILIIYSLSTGLLLVYGRALVFNPEYLISSRYAYQSKLGLIGSIWILYYLFNNKTKLFLNSILVSFINIVIVILNINNYLYENKISPYRRYYFDKCIELIQKPDDLDESNYGLFQDNKENIDFVIPLMRKYKLGIFYYE